MQVKTEKTIFGGRDFTKRVRVDKDGVFHISLPNWAKEPLNKLQVSGETLELAEKRFNTARTDFNKLLATDRKVICYQINLADPSNRHFFL